MLEILFGILIPLFGTLLGVACVVFMRENINSAARKMMSGFAGGIMVAASVWSLIIPAIEQSSPLGALSFLPAALGFVLGFLFLMWIDALSARFGEKLALKDVSGSTSLMIFAVTLHNIPEGMAVGAAFGAMLAMGSDVGFAAAIALSVGIAIQNVPEGAIVSLAARSDGASRVRSLMYGAVSGAVEPIFAAITLICVSALTAALPYCLAFAAGTMIYVVIEELIPDFSGTEQSRLGNLSFALGFTLMMVLDVALG